MQRHRIVDAIRQRKSKICRPVAIAMPGMRIAGFLDEVGDSSKTRHESLALEALQRGVDDDRMTADLGR